MGPRRSFRLQQPLEADLFVLERTEEEGKCFTVAETLRIRIARGESKGKVEAEVKGERVSLPGTAKGCKSRRAVELQ
jgi:hypothetical protein